MRSLLILAALCGLALGQAPQKSGILLDVRESGTDCCDNSPESLFLRVYANGDMEWETLDPPSVSMADGKEHMEWKKVLHQGHIPDEQLKIFEQLLAAPELRSAKSQYVFNTYIDTSITEKIRITTPSMTKEIAVTNFYPFLSHSVRKYPTALAKLVCAIDHRVALNTNYDDRAEQDWCSGKRNSIAH